VLYKVSRSTVVTVTCFICIGTYVEICEIIVAVQITDTSN